MRTLPRISLLRALVDKLLGRAGFLCISWLYNDAKLLHHSEVVSHRLVFHYLPISNAHDIDEPNRHLLAGRGIPRNSP
jgi:hypothetical protein